MARMLMVGSWLGHGWVMVGSWLGHGWVMVGSWSGHGREDALDRPGGAEKGDRLASNGWEMIPVSALDGDLTIETGLNPGVDRVRSVVGLRTGGSHAWMDSRTSRG